MRRDGAIRKVNCEDMHSPARTYIGIKNRTMVWLETMSVLVYAAESRC